MRQVVFMFVAAFVAAPSFADAGEVIRTFRMPQLPGIDAFGSSVGFFDDRVVIGTPRYRPTFNRGDVIPSNVSGAAYVFDRESGDYLERLTQPESDSTTGFANRIATASGRLFFSSPGGSGSAYGFGDASGVVDSVWKSPAPENVGGFGSSLAAQGNVLVVGAPGEADAGRAHILDVQRGVLRTTLRNPLPSRGDLFGETVATSGHHVLVAARGEDAVGIEAGAAYVFDRDSGALSGMLFSPWARNDERFGWNVAAARVDGRHLGLVANFDENAPGSVYVFDLASNALVRTLYSPRPDDNLDGFGASIAIRGDFALIGAPYSDIGDVQTGAAYLFNLRTGELLDTLINPNPSKSDRFGFSVALDRGRALIGAPQEENRFFDSGAAYLFAVVPEPNSMVLVATVTVVIAITNARSRRRRRMLRCDNLAV
jgi:hypothetical protein